MIAQVTRYDFACAVPVSQSEDSLDHDELLELELEVLSQEYELAELFVAEDTEDTEELVVCGVTDELEVAALRDPKDSEETDEPLTDDSEAEDVDCELMCSSRAGTPRSSRNSRNSQ